VIEKLTGVAKYTTTWSTEILYWITEAGFLIEVSTSYSLIGKHSKISGNIFRQFQLHEGGWILQNVLGHFKKYPQKEIGLACPIF